MLGPNSSYLKKKIHILWEKMFISWVDNHVDRPPVAPGTAAGPCQWDTAAPFGFRVCDTRLPSQQPPYFVMVVTSPKGPACPDTSRRSGKRAPPQHCRLRVNFSCLRGPPRACWSPGAPAHTLWELMLLVQHPNSRVDLS